MRRVVKILLCIAIPISSINSSSADTIDSFSSWSGLFFQVHVKDNWSLFLDTQTRLSSSSPSGNRFLIRPAVRYSHNSQLSSWFGYAWTPQFNPFRNENRIWQQISYTHSLGSWQIAHRLRLEERAIGDTPEVAFRARYMLRSLVHVAGPTNLSLCGWDEIFYALNSVNNGPSQGFDQNRLFLGINYKINDQFQLEPGYLHNYVQRTDPHPHLVFHAFVMYVWATL